MFKFIFEYLNPACNTQVTVDMNHSHTDKKNANQINLFTCVIQNLKEIYLVAVPMVR